MKSPSTTRMRVKEVVYGARQGTVIGETIQFVDASYQVGERNALSVAAEDLSPINSSRNWQMAGKPG